MPYKAKIVENKNNKYNVYVNVDGTEMPVARTIDDKLPIFDIVEWDTRDDAVEYINSKEGKLELLEEE
jgi:hypothetical protein